MSIAYEADFYGWVVEQTHLLKNHQFDRIDLSHLIEEMEAMGRSERRALASHVEVLLQHLLKWTYQPVRQTPSWKNTIKEQRKRIVLCLKENPSLKNGLDLLLIEAYGFAKLRAEEETGIPEETFPEDCPWTFEEMLNHPFF